MDIDSQKLDEVAALMEHHGLTRVRLSEEDGRVVELERMAAPVAMPVAAAPAATGVAAPVAVAEPAAAAAGNAAGNAAVASGTDDTAAHDAGSAATPADRTLVEVAAPMVGVFYAAPSPEAEPFVRAGSAVRAGDTLCIIEAMKLMNEVQSDFDGVVEKILVSDGQAVEYDQPVMIIK